MSVKECIKFAGIPLGPGREVRNKYKQHFSTVEIWVGWDRDKSYPVRAVIGSQGILVYHDPKLGSNPVMHEEDVNIFDMRLLEPKPFLSMVPLLGYFVSKRIYWQKS